ncbi:MAG: DUF561 domain-containing protein [Candidatus Gastranaerophilales bacterium]|nr:DUF561 domain-containing protein [Candidatus Gastranaerophilales bacterium]
MGIEVFKKHLRERRAVKIIAGINNYDLKNVAQVCKAAQMGHASAVDISADINVYKTARKNTKLPVFVSSIHPFELLEAAKWGADAIEIGNFDALYKEGRSFTSEEVYDIVLETMGLLNNYDVFTCVTIPGNIEISEQIGLARKLEILGVDLIQTEGLKKDTESSNPSAHLVSYAEATIANTLELMKHTALPIMSASGITAQTAPLAFASGASAVGVGSAVNKLSSEVEMAATVMAIVGSISHRNSLNREIIRTERELSLR